MIIEPFAGAAHYALKYWFKEVLLIDKYPVIVNIWNWLKECSPTDILSLPRPKRDEHLDNIHFDCQPAKDFMGFCVGCGAERPRLTPTWRKTIDRPNHVNYSLQRIAKNLFKIRHWTIIHGEYLQAPDLTATWFIDPPYQHGGGSYVMNNKKIDFPKLGVWAKNRSGQVIVCENSKADWMDFYPIKTQRGSLFNTTEVFWTNLKSSYQVTQQTLALI